MSGLVYDVTIRYLRAVLAALLWGMHNEYKFNQRTLGDPLSHLPGTDGSNCSAAARCRGNQRRWIGNARYELGHAHFHARENPRDACADPGAVRDQSRDAMGST